MKMKMMKKRKRLLTRMPNRRQLLAKADYVSYTGGAGRTMLNAY